MKELTKVRIKGLLWLIPYVIPMLPFLIPDMVCYLCEKLADMFDCIARRADKLSVRAAKYSVKIIDSSPSKKYADRAKEIMREERRKQVDKLHK